jgi:hypothetical protein
MDAHGRFAADAGRPLAATRPTATGGPMADGGNESYRPPLFISLSGSPVAAVSAVAGVSAEAPTPAFPAAAQAVHQSNRSSEHGPGACSRQADNMQQTPCNQTTCKRTPCKGQHATDNMQQTPCNQTPCSRQGGGGYHAQQKSLQWSCPTKTAPTCPDASGRPQPVEYPGVPTAPTCPAASGRPRRC